MSASATADIWAGLYYRHAERECGACTPTTPGCWMGLRLSRLLDRAGLALARECAGVAR